jgi:hypothetical protein
MHKSVAPTIGLSAEASALQKLSGTKQEKSSKPNGRARFFGGAPAHSAGAEACDGCGRSQVIRLLEGRDYAAAKK